VIIIREKIINTRENNILYGKFMVYKTNDGYILYKRKHRLKNVGKYSDNYFLAKKTPKVGTPCDLPPDSEVCAVNKNGPRCILYYLRKKRV